MHATPSQNSSSIPIQPPKFNGYTDVKSWFDAMEAVFLAKHVSSDQERMIWVRTALQPGIAVEFFESIQGIPSWENFRDMWTKRFTPYNQQFKFRQRWQGVRMKGEDIDRYISDFKRAMSFVPGVQNEEELYQFQVGPPSYLRLQVNVAKPTTLDAPWSTPVSGRQNTAQQTSIRHCHHQRPSLRTPYPWN